MYLSPNSSQSTKNLGNSKTNEIIFFHIFLFKHNSDVLMRSKQSTNLGFSQSVGALGELLINYMFVATSWDGF